MIIKGTVEERIVDLQDRKRELAKMTLEGKSAAGKLTMGLFVVGLLVFFVFVFGSIVNDLPVVMTVRAIHSPCGFAHQVLIK